MKQKETLGPQGNRPRKASTAPSHICANPPGTCPIVLLTIRFAILFHRSAHSSPQLQRAASQFPARPFWLAAPPTVRPQLYRPAHRGTRPQVRTHAGARPSRTHSSTQPQAKYINMHGKNNLGGRVIVKAIFEIMT